MTRSRKTPIVVLSVAFTILTPCAAVSQTAAAAKTSATETTKGIRMNQRAAGPFEVKLAPQPLHDKAGDAPMGRMSIDKQFRGALEATSKGEMLTAMGSVKGSAGYVAIEVVTGTLDGRRGSFALQHMGVMNRGAPTLTVSVVPDSGTGELEGISGKMNIIIAEGKHSYDFEYSIAK
jgi:Protein of unknown function (DUF3224)